MAQEVGSWGKGEGAGSGWGEGEGEEEGAGGRDEGDWGEGDGAGGISTPKIGSSAGTQAGMGIKQEREGRGKGRKIVLRALKHGEIGGPRTSHSVRATRVHVESSRAPGSLKRCLEVSQ